LAAESPGRGASDDDDLGPADGDAQEDVEETAGPSCPSQTKAKRKSVAKATGKVPWGVMAALDEEHHSQLAMHHN